MIKYSAILFLAFAVAGCSTPKTEKTPTAAQSVAAVKGSITKVQRSVSRAKKSTENADSHIGKALQTADDIEAILQSL